MNIYCLSVSLPLACCCCETRRGCCGVCTVLSFLSESGSGEVAAGSGEWQDVPCFPSMLCRDGGVPMMSRELARCCRA